VVQLNPCGADDEKNNTPDTKNNDNKTAKK
jgi:hypothetical protein